MDPRPPHLSATSPPGGASRRPAEERRRQILDRAAELFADRGYHGTRIRDISDACGVTEAVLYRHFDGKDAIFEETLRSRIDRHEIDAFLQQLPTDVPLEETFRTIALKILQIGREDPATHRLLLAASMTQAPARGAYVTWRVPFVQYLEERLRRGIERGELRPMNPTLSARAFVGLVMDCVLSCHLWGDLGHENPDPQQLVDNNVPTFVRGLLRSQGDDPGP